MSRKHYNGEFKARVAIEAIKGEKTVNELVFTCKNKLNIVNSVLFLIKGVYNGKKSANTLLFRE
jgi:hypothetical protein